MYDEIHFRDKGLSGYNPLLYLVKAFSGDDGCSCQPINFAGRKRTAVAMFFSPVLIAMHDGSLLLSPVVYFS